MGENFRYEIVNESTGLLTIDREKALNTLSLETMEELSSFLKEELPRNEPAVLVITGAGTKAFVAGADIRQMSSMNREEFRNYCELAHGAFNALQELNYPVIAALNGYTLGGGCELALACDIRYASDNVKIGFPETKLGIFPCWGGSQRSTRLLSLGKVKELIFSGDMITAEEALNIGLVDKVISREKLMEEVFKLASTISSNGPLAISYAKKVVNKGSELSLDEALGLELSDGLDCFDSDDRIEGMNAFLEKRKPQFKGE